MAPYADTYALGPPYCYAYRPPVCRVPKAQGCSPPVGALLYVRCTRTSLGRAVRTVSWHPRSDMVVGPLGSFTIVGSASFNLFVITAVCCAGMPMGQTRAIKQTGVFMTTATFSLIAYIWTVAMVSWWTPGVITIAEAVITFACMPFMLIVAQHGQGPPPPPPPPLALPLGSCASSGRWPAPHTQGEVQPLGAQPYWVLERAAAAAKVADLTASDHPSRPPNPNPTPSPNRPGRLRRRQDREG